MFASTAQVASTKDALEEYLATPPTKSITDPIGYWELHLRASKKDPGAQALGRMALNFLTIPGKLIAHHTFQKKLVSRFYPTATSTDAERAFSRGGLTVSRLRHSLGDASIRASALLGSWARVDGLVDEADAIGILKGKLRDSCVKDEDSHVPRTTMPKLPTAAVAVKVKQEPVSDDDTHSTSRATSSKAKLILKPRPAVKSGTSTARASTSAAAAKGATLPAPLVRRKSSKVKLPAASRPDKKGKRAARVPLDVEAIEISSDEAKDEDE